MNNKISSKLFANRNKNSRTYKKIMYNLDIYLYKINLFFLNLL